jgi:hypothetical protein
VPDSTPPSWRERWAEEATRFGQAPMPATFDDPPKAGLPTRAAEAAADARAIKTRKQVLDLVLTTLGARK